mmetsp:Transcript_32872/g.77962  ORF Transcript_32872/g.77962 Transcript_32872/m.77962 type:complete len:322 (-) Transcript_32872:553-1518(-)
MSRKDETQPDNKLCEDGSESFPFRPSRKRKIASTSAYWTLPENSKSVSMPSERESPPGEETKSKKDVVDLLKNLEKRFEGKLSSLKQNDISFEYNLVKGRGEKHSCGLQTSVGSAPKNADKNRYTDVIPFDMNCVELSGGQYVNASCVRVNAAGDGQRVFYAAQGPLKETTGDFWGMLYENKIPAIVMLTRFFEKTVSKCEPYFPEQEGTSQQHGDFEVEAVGKHAPLPYCKEVTVRTLRVTPLKGGDPLTVKHFFYGGWPDHGKPKSSTPIRQIIHELRMSGLNRKPVAVHCRQVPEEGSGWEGGEAPPPLLCRQRQSRR